MPKQQNKKNNTAGELYPVPKKHGRGSQTDESVDTQQGNTFYCDVCTESVNHLIQCDHCLMWYCCACGKITDHLITIFG